MNTYGAASRLTPGAKLTPIRGVSTAAAAVVALAVVAAAHHTSLAGIAIVSVLLVSLCDIGGSIRARTQAMGVATLGGALVFALGRSIGDPWWLAVPAIFVATLAAGLLGVYGPAAVALGLILNVAFAVALGMGGGPFSALPSLVGFLIGGACALLAALFSTAAQGTRNGQSAPHMSAPAHAAGPTFGPALARLTLRSSTFRFATLRAGGVALAAGIGWWLGVSHPHWAVITVILCVRPDPKASLIATTQRLAGTVLGAIVAELVIATVQDRLTLAGLGVALLVIAFTVRDMSGALFIFFLTIITLLLISIPSGGLSLAGLEVFETLIGAAIALAVTYLASRVRGNAKVPATPGSEPLADI